MIFVFQELAYIQELNFWQPRFLFLKNRLRILFFSKRLRLRGQKTAPDPQPYIYEKDGLVHNYHRVNDLMYI